MKYNRYIVAFAALLTLAISSSHATTASFKGIIESCSLTGNVPQYTIFYDGKQTYNDQYGFYLLPSQATETPLNILICKKIIESFETPNKIKHFYVSKDTCYKFYAEVSKLESGESLTETKLPENNKIPQNTIILAMDPTHVDTISHWDMSLPGELINLPKITLRSDLPSHTLEKSAVECTLCALDVARWHEKFPSVKDKSLA